MGQTQWEQTSKAKLVGGDVRYNVILLFKCFLRLMVKFFIQNEIWSLNKRYVSHFSKVSFQVSIKRNVSRCSKINSDYNLSNDIQINQISKILNQSILFFFKSYYSNVHIGLKNT